MVKLDHDFYWKKVFNKKSVFSGFYLNVVHNIEIYVK